MFLYHPALDRWHDFGSERAARVARKSGWQDTPNPDPVPEYETSD